MNADSRAFATLALVLATMPVVEAKTDGGNALAGVIGFFGSLFFILVLLGWVSRRL